MSGLIHAASTNSPGKAATLDAARLGDAVFGLGDVRCEATAAELLGLRSGLKWEGPCVVH